MLDKWAYGNRQAHSIKSYYVLAKSLNGFNLLEGERQEYYRDIPVILIDIHKGKEDEKKEKEKTLLDCIEEMGVWYVNYIATYNHKIYAGSGSSDYYNKASEAARTYLKQYANIVEPVNSTNKNFTLKTNQDAIIEPEGASDILLYKHQNLLKKEKDLTMSNPGYVGDGCNLFTTAVIRLFKEGKVGSIVGFTSEKMRKGSQTFDNAMYNLGFKKYQLIDGVWKCISKEKLEGDIVEMSLDELKPGDMLLRENRGHIEFYLGRKYIQHHNVDDNILFIENNEITDNNIIKNYTLTKNDGQLEIVNFKEGTFSFGRTHNIFPSTMNGTTNYYYYFTYNENNSKKFRLRYSTHDYNAYDNIGDYDTIWRYE